MTSLMAVFTLAWISASSAVDASCVPLEQPVESDEVADITASSVRLRLVEPANDAAVDADSVVVVEVDYRVANFQPGRFGLMMSFPALVSAASPHGPEGRYELPKASGRVRLCVPLRAVYEMPRLRWPLRMTVTLDEVVRNDSPKFSAVFNQVAASESVALNSVAPAPETERTQAGAVTPVYRDAVTALTGTIVQMEAAGEACARLPDLGVEFSAGFSAWKSRNEAVIGRVLELQRDLYSRDISRADIVEEVMKIQPRMAKAALEQLSPDELQAHCQYYSRAVSNPRSDLETAGAQQLAVIQTHAPARLPEN